ncbi:hypothetical protein [Flavihumibacter fluvii]|uniref:hypothetical protein n=1 Tax=Flavihumibacter fluvii TaxID=2838157 RepID=UPI001BDF65BC|nr:hypothetical protein [Flavihumibacter fluvii]ULQ54619.1 hypothetical protein KJS93_09840 [Flavihumibacter fluvii]
MKQWSTQSGYTNYGYSGNKLASATSYYSNGSTMSEYQFQFDASNRLKVLIETIAKPAANGAKKVKLLYSYYPNGNLWKMDTYFQIVNHNDFELSYSRVYEAYDDKKNPEPAIFSGHFLPGIYLWFNNPTQIRDITPNDNLDYLLRINYTYNSAGYPIRRVQQIEINGIPKPSISYDYVY